ncbi:unnamed protein product [Orchesella dallaii]|uniref:Odorant receptor n=1 Tax=Orchesella dallaii TaxID=48710 RepID=A0ABP1S1R9_9HEXA
MATPLMLATFELNQFIWRIGPYFKFYVEWNCYHEEFNVTLSQKRIFRWYIFGLLPQIALFINFIYLLHFGLHHPLANHPLNWIMTIFFFLLHGYSVVSHTYMCRMNRAQDIFRYVNAVLKFSKSNQNQISIENERGRPGRLNLRKLATTILSEFDKVRKGGNLDKPGLAVFHIALYFAMGPLILAFIAVGYLSLINLRWDPLYLALLNYCSYQFVDTLYSSYIFLILYSSTVSLFTFAEMNRVLNLFFTCILVIAHCTKQTLSNISKLFRENRKYEAMKEYKRLMLVHTAEKTIAGFIVFLLMGIGYAIIVLAASVTVMSFESLPMEVYWLFPATTAIGGVMLLLTFPYATSTYNFSQGMLREWNWKTASNSKHYKLSLRTLKPICFHFGSYRELNDEAEVVYLTSVIERVANGILFLNSI